MANDNKLSIAFTGDIAFDKYMQGKWDDEKLLSQEILSFLHDSDHVIPNVEGPVSEYEESGDGSGLSQMVHAINPKAVKVFNYMHSDVWNICNNHMMDIGEKGLYDTLENAKKAGVKTIGAGKDINEAAKPVYFDEAGGIGIFAVGYRGVKYGCKGAAENKPGCLNWNETEIIKKNIETIKKKCRWCIIVSHGGEEFTSIPSPYTRDRYLSFLEMGADIIVGHHPHVPMNYELFPNKAIFYSLGNFIFDTDYQRAMQNTNIGVIIKLHLTKEDFSFDAMGIKINREVDRVEKSELPDIFCDVDAKQYELLAPLEAKMFLAITKRQYTYIWPDKYKDFTKEQWKEDFLDPNRIERVEGEALDYIYLYDLALKEKEGAWKESTLDKVKEYMIRQM
ncbi:MAG: CapA family protein [Lachnospiraceae bacterium]|nr:CapA family protein [Lachnospiraceae bacterium]